MVLGAATRCKLREQREPWGAAGLGSHAGLTQPPRIPPQNRPVLLLAGGAGTGQSSRRGASLGLCYKLTHRGQAWPVTIENEE